MQKLIENQDYYLDKNGNMVFTKEYHLKRGHCCQSGCLNCPYGPIDPSVPQELNCNWSNSKEENVDEEENE